MKSNKIIVIKWQKSKVGFWITTLKGGGNEGNKLRKKIVNGIKPVMGVNK